MRGFFQKYKFLVFILVLAMLFAVAGCKGNDGATGATGATGPTGPAGPVTTTNESCVICHGSGQIEDIDSTRANSVHYNVGQDAAFLTISNIQLTNVGGAAGTLKVSFHVVNSSGNAYTSLTDAGLSVFIADLVPVNTIPIQGTAQKYQSRLFRQWASESVSGPLAGFLDVPWQNFDTSDKANGNYTITLAAGVLGTAAALPYVDLTNHVQRVTIMTSGKAASFSSIPPAIGVGVKDFTGVPQLDSANTSADVTAQYQAAHVTVDACKKCHGATMQGTAHGTYWADTRVCVTCHNPFFEEGPIINTPSRLESAKALFEQWIHEIHNGQNLGAGALNFSEVVFPQPIINCVACHQDPNGLTSGSNAEMDAWKTKPNATACTSCHETVNPLNVDVKGIISGVSTTLTAGQNHGGGARTADSCSGCHEALGTLGSTTDIVTVHKLPEFVDGNNATTAANATPMNTPEFDATITVTKPDGSAPAGGYFVTGDTPLITVTLKNHSDGTAVASSVYTTLSTDASSAKGVAGGGLNSATVYVYGPRNVPAPALTLHAASDRGESVLLPSTDPNVMTDSTGYKYLMQPISAATTTGTYVVGIQFMDYNTNANSTLAATDYKTATVTVALFQVKTATVTPNVAGDGSCANCHGTTRMHLTGSHAHNAAFDTDYCNMCHDTTGLHGNPIANRVHAVHSANSDGDLGAHASYDWSEVKFPQDVNNCKACHISSSTGYLTGYEPVACFGCHGSTTNNNATWDHMLQNGGKTLDQNPNFK